MSEIINGEAKCRIDQLLIGQRVNLQNDIIADPAGYVAAMDGEGESEHPEFEYEFAVVESITDETTNGEACLVVNFFISYGEFTCGFPPDHMVDVDGEQDLAAELPWLVTDEETRPLIKPLGRFRTEDEASAWIGDQPDKAKVYRGGYGLEGPAEDD